MSKLLLILSVFCLFIAGCNTGEECSAPETDRNHPNKSSELAVLMRLMKEKSFEMKTNVEQGKDIDTSIIEKFLFIHKAIPTDAKVKGSTFDLLANNYLDRLKEAVLKDSNQVEDFNIMVDACMACHKSFCPGPMKVIKKMYISHK